MCIFSIESPSYLAVTSVSYILLLDCPSFLVVTLTEKIKRKKERDRQKDRKKERRKES